MVTKALTVREGHAGQIWALDINFSLVDSTIFCKGIGLGRYDYDKNLDKGKWIYYPLGEKSNLDLPTIPFSGLANVIPSVSESVLILLPDRLIETDPIAGKTILLKRSQDTRLGKFIHLVESLDGGFWITAERGLAKVDGLSWHDKRECTSLDWKVWLFPPELGLQNLAHPIETRPGEVFGTALSLKKGRRYLVRFDDSVWEIFPNTGKQEIVMGWRGADDIIWVLKAESIINPLSPLGYLRLDGFNWITPTLWRIQNQEEHIVERELESSSYLWHLAVESDGAFWLAQERGITRYAPATWRVPPGLGTLKKNVFAAHEDRFNRLWFLSTDVLFGFNRGEWQHIPIPTSEPFERRSSSHNISSFPDGRVVFVTNDNRLFMTEGSEGRERVLEIPHPTGRSIAAVESRKDGGVWIASVNRVSNRIAVEVFDGSRFESILNEEQNLLAGTRYFQLLETDNGDLWMAGEKAIGQYKKGELRRFEIRNGIQTGPFRCLVEMEDGKIWLGSGNGKLADIVEFDGQKWRNSAEGISFIYDILRRRDGTVWAASTTGVYRNVEGSWISNRQEDGIYPDVYTLLEDHEGRLWAGTSHGIFLYHPEADPDPPKTTIREEDNLRNTPPGGEVRIVYSGIDKWNYTKPERLLYSHRMDKGPWSAFAAEKIAMYSGLSSGEHTFDVRAVDRNWNLESEPASFQFTVLVHWYQDPILLLLLILGSGTILILLGLHLYHHWNLESMVTKRTSALQNAYGQLRTLSSELIRTEERERRQLAADLHDSISQSLSVSMMELSAINEVAPAGEIRDHLGTIKEQLDAAFLVTQNLTFDLCPLELYQVGLESAIRELTVRLQKQYGIDIALDTDGIPKSMSDDTRYFLFRSTRELLLNVVKHSQATAVRVNVRKVNTSIQIRVYDDGVGFEPNSENVYASEHGSFGLFSIRERAHQLGGMLTIHSESGQGTVVTVVVPFNDFAEPEEGGRNS